MYVLHAWKSCLQIFIPSNFKLFLLVTLKTIMSTFKSYLKYGWPFIIVVAFGTGLLVFLNDPSTVQAVGQGKIAPIYYLLTSISLFVYVPAVAFCNFLVAIFARPSVDQKNCAYMRSYAKRFFIGCLFLNILFMVGAILLSFNFSVDISDTVTRTSASVSTDMPQNVIQHFFVLVWYITNLFGILFYLDLGGSFFSIFKSIWYACKMTFYSLPFVAILAGVLLLAARIGDDYLQIFSYMHLLLYPFLFCFITTLYTKKVHDQARLYQGN